jgi:PKD repeat protein
MIIQINDCYNCPTVAPIQDITKCAGEQVSFKANGQDLDGDSLTYTITGKPDGASFNTQTGQFTWNSQVSNSGTFNMNVCVSDNTQFCPQPVCTPVKVTLNNCNDCPVVQPVDIKKVCEEDVIEFYLSASDADNDGLTYSIIGTLPTGATFDSSTGHFYWQTHICNSGDYNLQWCASDGQCTRCAPLNIEVIDCWEPPKACFTYQPSSPKCGETITFDASCSSDPKGLALNYQWDFNGDGVIDATGVTATYTPNCEQCDGCFNAKLTVSNSYFADTESKQVCIGAGEQLEVEGITCFPVVIQHSLQSCSVTLTEKIGDVQITLKDKVTDEVLGTCQTDRLTGACTDNFPRDVLGQFEVYATAQKTGYTGDNDETPAYPYIVIAERYEIEDLKVYNEQNYQTEDYDFYRAENMYVKFLVRDKTTGQCTTDVITEADLVSPPGGRAQLSQFKAPEGCYYYYWLNIPPTHGFLGVSQVFTFAFNFEDQTGGEAYVDLTIRNNLPQIEPAVPSQTMIQGTCAEYNLASHKHDIEDSGDDLRWEASGIGSGFTVSINDDTMKVCALQSGSAQFTLKLFDLDNDFDSQLIGAEGGDNKLPPISNPNGPYRYLEGQEIQLSSSGSRDPDGGAIVSYSWQFGDGQVSNLANPKHVYANNGTYLVTLTVTDDEGASATATTHAYISLPVEPDKTLYRDDLFVKHLEVNANNIVKKGDKEITVRATIENRGELDVKNMKLTLMVRELGLQQTFRHVRLDSDEAINKYVRFINPGIPGKYTLMLHLATESGIERTKFVEFEVI